MRYTVDYISKPVTPERVQSLLDDINRDLEKLDQIEAHRGTAGNDYQGTVERIRNTYSLAESLAAKLPTDDDDSELKDWANKQIDLTNGWY